MAGIILAIPAMAQAQVGGAPDPVGPLGGFPAERADTGASAGTLDYIHDLEKFAFEKSGSPEAKRFANRAAAFLSASKGRREEAFALGVAAQRGERVEVSPATLRRELEQDLVDWRDAFDVQSREYRTIREKLLTDGGDLTAGQWALRRASWFQARDHWIEQHKRDLGIAP
ncbi:MAG: hypothetical protein ABIQ32_10420 [Sphingomicrobium sp.]